MSLSTRFWLCVSASALCFLVGAAGLGQATAATDGTTQLYVPLIAASWLLAAILGAAARRLDVVLETSQPAPDWRLADEERRQAFIKGLGDANSPPRCFKAWPEEPIEVVKLFEE